jgi:hypothetical protein
MTFKLPDNLLLITAILLFTLVSTAVADPTPLTSNRHIFVDVANDAGVKYDIDGAAYGGPGNTYYIKADGGGLNSTWIAPNAADTTKIETIVPSASSSTSGTLYLNDAGGRGFSDDIILLLSVRGPIADNFSINIKTGGYTWTPATPGKYNPLIPTTAETGALGTATSPLADGSLDGLPIQGVGMFYQPVALDETFTKADFIYGPQVARPGPGGDGITPTWSLPLYPSQDMSDPSTAEYLMFIDLEAGAMRNTALTDNGAVKIDYTINNLYGDAAFNMYAWVAASNQGEGISFANPPTNGYWINYTGSPAAAVTYSPAGPYKAGTSVTMDVAFSKEMLDSPAPMIELSGADSQSPISMVKVDSTHYTFSYIAGSGNGVVNVALSTGTDLAGNPVIPVPISGPSFMVDNTAPTIVSATPAAGDNEVSLDSPITVTFSEAMDPSTITDSTFLVNGVSGTVEYDRPTMTAKFTPASALDSNTQYNVTVTSGVKDLARNAMAADGNWTFKTTTVVKTTPAVTWSNPADIGSGTPLGSTQLNATASVAGTFVYSPAAGTLLEPGVQTLSTTFTPTDSVNYYPATASVTINVIPIGNMNGGSSATVADALKALQCTVGLYTPSAVELARGDVSPLVNGKPAPDGKIDVGDALVILKRVVALINW